LLDIFVRFNAGKVFNAESISGKAARS
jgi:hypothetical protein